MSGLPCPYCSGEFSAPSDELLLTHIRLVHSYDPGFTIQCSLNGCSITFSNFKAYQKHRRLKHSSNTTGEDTQLTPGSREDFEDLDESQFLLILRRLLQMHRQREICSHMHLSGS